MEDQKLRVSHPTEDAAGQLIKQLLENMGYEVEKVSLQQTALALKTEFDKQHPTKHFICKKLTLEGLNLSHSIPLNVLDASTFQRHAATQAKELIQTIWNEATCKQFKKESLISIGDRDPMHPRFADLKNESAATLLINTGECNVEALQKTFCTLLQEKIAQTAARKESYANAAITAAALQTGIKSRHIQDFSGTKRKKAVCYMDEYLPAGEHPIAKVRVQIGAYHPKVCMSHFLPEPAARTQPNDPMIEHYYHDEFETLLKRPELHANLHHFETAWSSLPPLAKPINGIYEADAAVAPDKFMELHNTVLTFNPPNNVNKFLADFIALHKELTVQSRWPKADGIHWMDEEALEKLPSVEDVDHKAAAENKMFDDALSGTLANKTKRHDSAHEKPNKFRNREERKKQEKAATPATAAPLLP